MGETTCECGDGVGETTGEEQEKRVGETTGFRGNACQYRIEWVFLHLNRHNTESEVNNVLLI